MTDKLFDAEALARRMRKLYPKSALDALKSFAFPEELPPPTPDPVPDELVKYVHDPVGFGEDVLGVVFTSDQQNILRALPGRVKMESGHNVGKAQPLDLMIDTPDGRVRFGDLNPGDRVFGSDGRPIRVVAVHPQGKIPQYRVTFDDHTSTLVSGGHLWTVRGRQGRRTTDKWKRRDVGGWETLTTEELMSRGVKRKNGKSTTSKWEIPRHGPAHYGTWDVPVGPYTMGVWLGDGTVGIPRFTSADPEIAKWVAEETGLEVREYPTGSKAKSVAVIGLRDGLREAGVFNTPTDQKRVPLCYKENGVAVRLAVLQGLLDTDGTVDTGGRATFCSTSRGLVEDVVWLVRSLGGKASIHPGTKRPWYRDSNGVRVNGKDAYNCSVELPNFKLFRLRRKQVRVRSGGRLGVGERMIESIESAGTAEMQCITVDALDGLYLTNDFIVTHNSFLLACMLLWWHYTRNPSVVICVAPTSRAVEDILWTEVRLIWQRAKRRDLLPDHFIGPKAPEMFATPDWWAKGYTTSSGEGYQGRHRENMMFLFDEDEDISVFYWETTTTMFQPGGDDCWVCACNPITTTSRSAQESRARGADGGPKFKLFSLSSLNHPNVKAELRGEPQPVPNAVSKAQVDQWVADWATPIDDPTDRQPSDFEWPPESGKWFRPGPTFKARAQGVRPTEGVDAVWSLQAWQGACVPRWTPRDVWTRNCKVTIGVDTALFGSNDTAFHVRSGPLSLFHESHNGWDYKQSADRLKALCVIWASWYNQQATDPRPLLGPADVEVIIEADGGFGPGIHSHRDGYENWKLVTVGGKSDKLDANGRPLYANVRSEMWIEAALLAKKGLMDVSRLLPETKMKLENQLLPVQYSVKPDGSRMVESKEDIEDRIGRSPDDATALMISHFKVSDWSVGVVSADDQ